MLKYLQLTALIGVLLLVEYSALWRLTYLISWTHPDLIGLTAAAAFELLLYGGVVALAQAITWRMRLCLILSSTILFTAQACANVIVCYNYASKNAHIESLIILLGLHGDQAYQLISVVCGLGLSTISALFWYVVGMMLRSMVQRSEIAVTEKELQNLLGGGGP